jgi:hypothetical protein
MTSDVTPSMYLCRCQIHSQTSSCIVLIKRRHESKRLQKCEFKDDSFARPRRGRYNKIVVGLICLKEHIKIRLVTRRYKYVYRSEIPYTMKHRTLNGIEMVETPDLPVGVG